MRYDEIIKTRNNLITKIKNKLRKGKFVEAKKLIDEYENKIKK